MRGRSGLTKLLGLSPSTETLVELVRGMVGHFLQITADEQESPAYPVDDDQPSR